MAARLNKRHQDMVREKIRASQLINRLENYIFAMPQISKPIVEWIQAYGDSLPEDGLRAFERIFEKASVSMDSAQVTAALGLLKKAVPDLKAIELAGPDGGDIPLSGTVKFKKVKGD